MLLQSHDPYSKPLDQTKTASAAEAFLHLLPALPSRFADGTVSGLRARGGFAVDLRWRAGKLERATVRASQSRRLRLRYAGREVALLALAGRTIELDANLGVVPPKALAPAAPRQGAAQPRPR